MQGKVEICGVNTAKLPVLKGAEMRALLEKAHDGDKAAREALIAAGQTEAADILHKLFDELPFYSWSEEAIYDSVEQFILDYGRVPTSTDFKKRSLPPHPVVKRRFGMTLKEWLDQNYPARKPLAEEVRVKATDAFLQDYFRIQPRSAAEFNARRTPGAHCWYTVAVLNQTTNWRSLLQKLELPIYNNHNVPEKHPQLTVKIISDYDFAN